MTIHGGTVGEIEFASDPENSAPLNKGFFDRFQLRMLADGAAAAVLRQVQGRSWKSGRRRFGWLHVWGEVFESDGGHGGDLICGGEGV